MAKITIDVKDKRIETLMDEVKSGKFRLPSFQRQFVWDEDDIRDLIDSIINNYPIGTIILWKPSNANIELDPFSKPLIDVDQRPREIFYVIDGQQRLTSLLLLFNDWKIKRDDKEIKCEIPISYDPKRKRLYKSARKGIDLSKLVKAFCLQDIKVLNEVMRQIPEKTLKETGEKIRRILIYPIPICTMETFDEDEETFKSMAEAFIRINRYGVRIGNLELMLSFLAGAVSGELKEKIRDLYEELYNKFEIDLQPVIRFTFSNFGLKQAQISKVDQFKRNIRKISEYSAEETRKIFDKCEKAMNLTLMLLEKQLGITSSRLLPSQTPLIPISTYFHHKDIDSLDELDDRDIESIVKWFVLVSFNGYYSSRTDTKLDKDIVVIKESSYFPLDKLLENMKSRKAKVKITDSDIKKGLEINVLRSQGKSYLFLLYIILVRKGADDWTGVLLRSRKFTELAKHHIFPKEYLEQKINPEDPDTKEILINNLANITFIHKDINSEIEDKPPHEYLKEYIDSAKKHFIPTDNTLWRIEQYDTFLNYRIKQIYSTGKEIFGDIFE